MLVQPTGRAPNDLTRVGLNEEWEVQYWCTSFETKADELRACVARVGPRVQDIERDLGRAAKAAFKNTGED